MFTKARLSKLTSQVAIISTRSPYMILICFSRPCIDRVDLYSTVNILRLPHLCAFRHMILFSLLLQRTINGQLKAIRDLRSHNGL